MDTAVKQLSELKETIKEQIQEKSANEPPPAVLPSLESESKMDELV